MDDVRRIVFLDIDGVLNNSTWSRPRGAVNVDPRCVAVLNGLVRPGVEWVLSSTWRGDGSIQARNAVEIELRRLGWSGRFTASTPCLRPTTSSIYTDYSRGAQATRGDEISAWLAAEGHEKASLGSGVRLAILDDDSDVGNLRPFLVEVDERVGLTSEDVGRALSLLGLE